MSQRPWKEVEGLLRDSDPAACVDAALLDRVARRLAQPKPRSRASRFVIAAVVGGSILSGLAFAAAAQLGLWPASAPMVQAPPQPAVEDDDLEAESALLREALTALTAGDAAQALASVDTYAVRFPHGALALEVEVLRARALAQAGRDVEAIAAFERLPPGTLPTNLTLTWVDLLVTAGRCSEATRLAGPLTAQSLTQQQTQLRQQLLARCQVQGPAGQDP